MTRLDVALLALGAVMVAAKVYFLLGKGDA
jgi:hypothetical protein